MNDDSKLTTVSIREATLTKIKLISAVLARPQYDVVAEIVDNAFMKIVKEEGKPWFEPNIQK